MSNEIFPSTLAGYAWDSKKKPVFNNIVHSPVTGRDIRIALYSQPVYEFTLTNQWLTKADKDALMGFFLARRGQFDSFLYADEDCVAVADPFGNFTVNAAFQLIKHTGGFAHTVNNVAGMPAIYLANRLLDGYEYSINATGLVAVHNAIGTGLLTWSGSAYYRCIFLEDSLEYNQFADRLYDCGEIKFKGCMANKL
jgi:hypothetical protein